jgi:hypothetical protein
LIKPPFLSAEHHHNRSVVENKWSIPYGCSEVEFIAINGWVIEKRKIY